MGSGEDGDIPSIRSPHLSAAYSFPDTLIKILPTKNNAFSMPSTTSNHNSDLPRSNVDNEVSIPSVSFPAYSDKTRYHLAQYLLALDTSLVESICSVKPKRTKSKHLV